MWKTYEEWMIGLLDDWEENRKKIFPSRKN